MELVISILAMLISLISVVVSVAIYILGIRRERKQATLDAFNVLQVQVFDNINQYTVAEIKEICDVWKQVITDKQKQKNQLMQSEEEQRIRNKCVEQYRLLSGYLARIEHFSLGVNTKIYDENVVERAATAYLTTLYRVKLKPLIDVKHSRSGSQEYYSEFRMLVEKIEKIEKIDNI